MNIPVLLMLGAIGILGFFCQWLAWRSKLPAILFLLLCGILLGPTFHILDTDALFGDLLFPFVSLSVSIILFEGSLTLKRSELHDIGSTVRKMVSTGIFITATIVTLTVHYVVGLSWQLSALFGSIMVVTGPTVIMPMLRSARLNHKVARVLRWEGIIIDPVGALLAVLVFEFIVTQQTSTELSHVAVLFSSTIAVGTLTGLFSAFFLGQLLRHHWIPEYLQNFASLAFVCGTFAVSETMMHESGLIAVTIMGIWLANMKGVNIRSILHFKENLTIVFVSVLFIILAARLDFKQIEHLGWGSLIVLLVMQFVARPAKVFFSTRGTSFSFKEKLILSWIGPRGIVAAAVSAVFALRLEQLGVPQAELIVPLTFCIIIGTVVMQGTTARPLAVWLKVTEPNTKAYMIVGGNPVALTIAKALKDVEIETIVCDNYWDNIAAARMAGLKTYYGNPISNHADVYLDTSQYGGVLGLSYFHERNMAAALRYREDFGVDNVFCLASSVADKNSEHAKVDRKYSGHTLFGKTITYSVLNDAIGRGAQARKTQLTDNYTYENWLADREGSDFYMLFAITSSKKLQWALDDKSIKPESGWTIVYLAFPKEAERSAV